MKPEMHKYRIYNDGEIIYEDDFAEQDDGERQWDNYQLFTIPDALLAYLHNEGATEAEFYRNIKGMPPGDGSDISKEDMDEFINDIGPIITNYGGTE